MLSAAVAKKKAFFMSVPRDEKCGRYSNIACWLRQLGWKGILKSTKSRGEVMSNLETIQAYHEAVWTKKDIQAADCFFDASATVDSTFESKDGLAEMKSILLKWYQGFPDIKVFWDDYICEGDHVVSRWHAEGTHGGEFSGHPASHNPVSYSGITVYKLNAQGKICEYSCCVDMLRLLSQLV